MKTIRTLADLQPDPRNANRGSKRGLELLEQSLERNGLGRSVLVDRNGLLIAGNKTTERVADLTAGDVEVIVVKTNGRQLVVVQREDLDLTDPKDARARELAIADNRVAEVDLDWDPNVLLQTAQADTFLEQYFFPDELAKKWGQADEEGILERRHSGFRKTDIPKSEDPSSSGVRTEADPAAAPAHDPADEDQSVTCPECGHSWEPA
jgi:hypothetical protein